MLFQVLVQFLERVVQNPLHPAGKLKCFYLTLKTVEHSKNLVFLLHMRN